MIDPWALLAVPFGLGLLGFIEPCTVGSSLLFVKYLEGKDRAARVMDAAVFTITRALFVGSLGALAALVGTIFTTVQRGFWIALGAVYVIVGALYLTRRQWIFMRTFGPALTRARGARGGIALGVIFGLNIPACAAPILGALLAASAGTAGIAQGFVAMGVFGFALSLPLLGAVLWPRGRQWLDRISALSQRVPLWTGVVFVGLGLWSIYYGVTSSGTA